MLTAAIDEASVRVSAGAIMLEGSLAVPDPAVGVVLFAHGSGSSRHSPRNRYVARQLEAAGLATLLFDLLTEAEERAERETRHLRFDIGLLAERLAGATDWLAGNLRTAGLPVGYFGASTGGGAALVAATRRPERVAAVASRGGRPDLAGDALPGRRPDPAYRRRDDEPSSIERAGPARLGRQSRNSRLSPGRLTCSRAGTLEKYPAGGRLLPATSPWASSSALRPRPDC